MSPIFDFQSADGKLLKNYFDFFESLWEAAGRNFCGLPVRLFGTKQGFEPL